MLSIFKHSCLIKLLLVSRSQEKPFTVGMLKELWVSEGLIPGVSESTVAAKYLDSIVPVSAFV